MVQEGYPKCKYCCVKQDRPSGTSFVKWNSGKKAANAIKKIHDLEEKWFLIPVRA